jgi:hypothetical protein
VRRMPRRRATAVAWAAAGLVALVCALPGTAAAAAPASCATPPAAYTGSDPVVAAVTQQTIDADTNCQALADRVDQVDGDVSQSHADAVAVKTATDAVKAAVDAVQGTVSGWTTSSPLAVTLPSGGSGHDVTVTNWPAVQTVGLDAPSSSAQDGIGQALHGDLWVIVGVIVGTFLFGEALRKIWP